MTSSALVDVDAGVSDQTRNDLRIDMSATTPIYVKWLDQDVPVFYGSHVIVSSNGRDITLMAGRILPEGGVVSDTGEARAAPVAGITIPLSTAEELAASLNDVLRRVREAQ